MLSQDQVGPVPQTKAGGRRIICSESRGKTVEPKGALALRFSSGTIMVSGKEWAGRWPVVAEAAHIDESVMTDCATRYQAQQDASDRSRGK